MALAVLNDTCYASQAVQHISALLCSGGVRPIHGLCPSPSAITAVSAHKTDPSLLYPRPLSGALQSLRKSCNRFVLTPFPESAATPHSGTRTTHEASRDRKHPTRDVAAPPQTPALQQQRWTVSPPKSSADVPASPTPATPLFFLPPTLLQSKKRYARVARCFASVGVMLTSQHMHTRVR